MEEVEKSLSALPASFFNVVGDCGYIPWSTTKLRLIQYHAFNHVFMYGPLYLRNRYLGRILEAVTIL